MNTIPKIHRYPGVKPFETADKDLFFGRKRDIQDLYDLISLEKLVVLFAKSGYGKSSILNAGIVPKILADNAQEEEAFDIIKIRLGAFSEEKTDEHGTLIQERKLSPADFLRHKLQKNYPIQPESHFLTQKFEDENIAKNLWYDFKCRQNNENPLRFVLLFDQFEEFFSYPLAEQNAFKQELATLLYENIPQNVRDLTAHTEKQDKVWLSRKMDIKIVFAIRADKMNFLHSLANVLPAILHKRYELKALSSEQAKEAIVAPASIKGEHFVSQAFEYKPDALDKIIAALTEANSDTKTQGIEAFQLQLLCEYIENKVINGEVPDIDGNGLPDITPETLPVMERLYEEYYHRKLKELPPQNRLAAQLVLEDGLLAEDSATGEGRRMSVDSHALLSQFRSKGLNESVLQALANTFLIRAETNTVGGISYEISHDTLLAPIQKTKAERKAKEEKEALAEKAATEKAEKEKAQKQLRTVQILLAVAVVALLVAGWAIWQANEATKSAEKATIAAKAAESFAKKERAKSDSLLARSETMRKQLEEKTGIILQKESDLKTSFERTKAALIEAKEKEAARKREEEKAKLAEAKEKALKIEEILKQAETFCKAKLFDKAKTKYEEALTIAVENRKAEIRQKMADCK